MPREVTHVARGPRKLTREDFENEKETVAVCQCGLSDEYPFCDGSHRRTADEDPETLYRYVDGERRVVAAVEYADAGDAEATDPDGRKGGDEGGGSNVPDGESAGGDADADRSV